MGVIIFAILAGFFKAVMDRTGDPIAFRASIFAKLNPMFWEKTTSAEYIKFLPFTSYRPDAWHLAGTGLIGSAGMIAGFASLECFSLVKALILGPAIATIITLSFNLFYSHLLKK